MNTLNTYGLLPGQVLEGLEKAEKAGNRFAGSLLDGYHRYNSFTEKQRLYAYKIAAEALGVIKAQESASVEIKADKISAMFAAARENKIKYPKIKISDEQGNTVKFQLAGPNSRYAGKIMVTDGEPFGMNKWYGVIDNNVFIPSRNYQDNKDIIKIVKDFAENPAGVAKAYGQRTNNCCFCGRELTEGISVELGIGPICGERYGLR